MRCLHHSLQYDQNQQRKKWDVLETENLERDAYAARAEGSNVTSFDLLADGVSATAWFANIRNRYAMLQSEGHLRMQHE